MFILYIYDEILPQPKVARTPLRQLSLGLSLETEAESQSKCEQASGTKDKIASQSVKQEDKKMLVGFICSSIRFSGFVTEPEIHFVFSKFISFQIYYTVKQNIARSMSH